MIYLKKYWLLILVVIALIFGFSFINKKLVVDYFLKEQKIKLRDSLIKERDFIIQRKIDSLDSIPVKKIFVPYKVVEYKDRTVKENLKILSE